jgi:hypothetical protein
MFVMGCAAIWGVAIVIVLKTSGELVSSNIDYMSRDYHLNGLYFAF